MVTRSVEGPIRRCTIADLRSRALRVAKALEGEGVELGDRIATLAWNTERHVEAWFGIMGNGAICHTLNPRLFAEQLDYIINHADVSRKHARLRVMKNRVFIEDLGSTNGTSVNGQSIDDKGMVSVDNGDQIIIGSVVMKLRVMEG